MKKIRMDRIPNGVNAPVPVGPAPVPVTHFEKEATDAYNGPPLPVQMNAPVGPPPPIEELPTDFEGYIDLAKQVSRGVMTDKAQLWAMLAQATQLERIARALENLVDFTDAPEVPVSQDGPIEFDVVPSRLAEAIADGIRLAGMPAVMRSEAEKTEKTPPKKKKA